jgi:hypothetical protein
MGYSIWSVISQLHFTYFLNVEDLDFKIDELEHILVFWQFEYY